MKAQRREHPGTCAKTFLAFLEAGLGLGTRDTDNVWTLLCFLGGTSDLIVCRHAVGWMEGSQDWDLDSRSQGGFPGGDGTWVDTLV